MDQLIVLITILFGVCCWGQHPVYRNLGVNDGLPGSASYFVINDQNGYVWMAGDQGISRFDGRNFRNFFTAKNVTANSII